MIDTNFETITGRDVAQAAEWLKKGTCVAIPTETVYGLAANALDTAAVARIFAIKNRPSFDPLIVHVPSLEAAQAYSTEFPAPLARLALACWPGPLTILVPKSPEIPDLVSSGLPRVALRMPAHPMALDLLQRLPFPLAAPSANPFGYISPTTAAHVHHQLGGKIPYILDGGPCTVGVESTIVGWENERLTVYRLGGIALESIETMAGPVHVQLNHSSNPAAPGMLHSHYAPRKPFRIGQIPELLDQAMGQKVGVLSFTGVAPEARIHTQWILSEKGDLEEAARNLFAALRALDASEVDLIIGEYLPETGLGRAINDRLRRAAV